MKTKRSDPEQDARSERFLSLIEDFPRLTFYYGLSFEELARMPRWVVDLYRRELPTLLGGEQMRAIEASSFPHAKRSTQRSVVRRLEKVQRRARRQPVGKSESLEDFQGAIATMGFGFVAVTPPEEPQDDAMPDEEELTVNA